MVGRTPRRKLAAILAAVAWCTGCASSPPPPPSEAEARAFLASVVELVAEGDLERVCEMGSGTCPHEAREADPATRPNVPPRVVGTEVIQPVRRDDGAWDLGGYLLELCGVDGLGKPYYSEMLVFRDHSGKLIAINTLYWLGARLARNPAVGAPSEPSPC